MQKTPGGGGVEPGPVRRLPVLRDRVPFNIPAFEWERRCAADQSASCVRPAAAGQPAGVRGYLPHGRAGVRLRTELLAEAHQRIADHRAVRGPGYTASTMGRASVLYSAKAGVALPTWIARPGRYFRPVMPEKIQHTIIQGLRAPLALLAVLGFACAATPPCSARGEEEAAVTCTITRPGGRQEPDWPFLVLLLLFL